jgi:hypothetical protein
LCRTAASDQSRVLEDLQMLGNRLNADREGLGEVTEFVSLDGVLEDPGGSEGFKYGGWSFEVNRGEEGDKFKLDEVLEAEAQLLGRVTYEG